jgi:hypothetical protein
MKDFQKGMSPVSRFIIVFGLLFGTYSADAQHVSDSVSLNIDSLEQELDAFLALYNRNKKQSYFHFSASLNNTQISLNNLALNTQQINTGLSITPSLEYVHKTGISISYSHYLSLKTKESGVVQHSFNAGYLFSRSRKIDFGLNYTHYITNPSLSAFASPYKNDWYTFATWNHARIQPTLSIGYATGDYSENKQRIEKLVITRPLRGDTTIQFTIYDSLKVRLQDFTTALSLKKRYVIEGKKADRFFVFTPSVLLMFFQNNNRVEYKSASAFAPRTQVILQNQPRFAEILRNELNQQFPGLNETRGFLSSGGFNLQSMGVNIDCTAYFGKFYINPRVYADYYLLSSENNFNLYFSLMAGVYLF